MDMRFYWVRDRVQQQQFNVRWRPGKHNLADYPTKHHTGQHHQQVRPIYLYDQHHSPKSVQGCIKIFDCKPKAMRAHVKRRVTWHPNMPTWKGKRCNQRCTPKDFPLTKTIHSPDNMTNTSSNMCNSNKSWMKLPKRMSSFY